MPGAHFALSRLLLGLVAVLACAAEPTKLRPSPHARRLLNITTVRGLFDGGGSVAASIARGWVPPRGRFPYVVALGDRRGSFLCGGTLISDRHILTAAHCVLDDRMRLSNPPAIAYVGLYNWMYDSKRQYEVLNVKRVAWHSSYRRSNLAYDVAVLELSKKAKTRPVMLAPVGYSVARKTVIVAGFGATERSGISPQLMATTMPVQPTSVCAKVMIMPPSHLCLGSSTMQSAGCSGDSGGPAILAVPGKPDVQVGIYSFVPRNFKCGGKGSLAAATSVMQVRRWIDTILKQSDGRGGGRGGGRGDDD